MWLFFLLRDPESPSLSSHSTSQASFFISNRPYHGTSRRRQGSTRTRHSAARFVGWCMMKCPCDGNHRKSHEELKFRGVTRAGPAWMHFILVLFIIQLWRFYRKLKLVHSLSILNFFEWSGWATMCNFEMGQTTWWFRKCRPGQTEWNAVKAQNYYCSHNIYCLYFV